MADSCSWCKGPIPADRRADTLYCRVECRGLAKRERQRQSPTRKAANAAAVKRYKHSAKGVATQRNHTYRSQYGITLEDYESMLEFQGGVCALCGRPPKKVRLAVDHDHKTGRVRGLLCSYCNQRQLGRGREVAEMHRRIAAYLDSPPWEQMKGPG